MALTTSSKLKVIFGRMREAYYFKAMPTLANTTDVLSTADYEMPISEDGVNFEPVGSPNITRNKITNGAVWYSFAEKGDANVTLQIPSFHKDLDALFLEKASSSTVTTKYGTSDTFEGNAYNLEPKKFTGAWLFTTAEKDLIVILPNTENFGIMVGAKGKEMGYFNVSVTPMRHETYGDIVILEKKTASGS